MGDDNLLVANIIPRLEDFKLTKNILNDELDKKRKIGGPKLRWFEDRIKRWMHKAKDR